MISRIKAWLSKKPAKAKLAAGVLTVLFLTAGVTAAYLIYQAKTVNRFRIGSNTISVTEDFEPPKKQDPDADNIFKKQVKITNEDNTNAFVRVFMDFSDSSIKDLAQISSDGTNYVAAKDYPSNLPDGWTYISEDDPDSGADLGGYYYYTKALKPKDSTNALVEKFKVNYGGDGDKVRDFDILVVADSIQTWVNDDAGDGSFAARDVSGDSDGWKEAWKQYLTRKDIGGDDESNVTNN
jgi:hypothetical protein